jgi:hypothetical protein
MANNNINSPDEQTTSSTSNSSNGIAGAPEEAMSRNQTIDQAVGVIDEAYMLVENLPRKMDPNQPQDIDCFLCRKMGKELKTIYSCVKCQTNSAPLLTWATRTQSTHMGSSHMYSSSIRPLLHQLHASGVCDTHHVPLYHL